MEMPGIQTPLNGTRNGPAAEGPGGICRLRLHSSLETFAETSISAGLLTSSRSSDRITVYNPRKPKGRGYGRRALDRLSLNFWSRRGRLQPPGYLVVLTLEAF